MWRKAPWRVAELTPVYSIIVPIYCEQENLSELYKRVVKSFSELDERFEIIFVNDSSDDDSMKIMREMNDRDPRVKIISLSRNFGHQLAITAGLRHAEGKVVVVMDGDLQDPPEVAAQMARKLEDGKWDVVYAVRKKRQEPLPIRIMYSVFYRMLRQTSYIRIPIDAGDFCVMNRRTVSQMNQMPERNPFVRGLRSWVGFRQTGFEYERAARYGGESKYNWESLFKLALDGILSFSYLPLRLSTMLGAVISAVGLFYAMWLIFSRLVFSRYESIAGWTTVVVSVLVLGGVQLIMLGIIGEYLGRMYEEVKGRPMYIVDEYVGFDKPPSD